MQSIARKLQLTVGGLVLLIVAFVVVYFPMQQRAEQVAAFEGELEAVCRSLAIAFGTALENEDYRGLRRAIDHVKQGADFASIEITTGAGDQVAVYPPGSGSLGLSIESDGFHRGDSLVSFRAPIVSDGEVAYHVTLTETLDSLDASIANARLNALGVGLAILFVSLLAVRKLSASFAAPILELGQVADEVAAGRLSSRVDLRRDDELGQLAARFDQMVDGLRAIVASVGAAVHDVAQAARALDEASETMAADLERQGSATEDAMGALGRVREGASEVSESVEQLATATRESSVSLVQMDSSIRNVASSMDELSSSLDDASSGSVQMVAAVSEVVRTMESLTRATSSAQGLLEALSDAVSRVDESARSCGEAASQTLHEAEKGSEVVQRSTATMNQVNGCFEQIEERAQRLVAKSDEVGAVVSIIQNITEQTSLLSLNAAIIAAQAGENGRAFAVVADEVKVLSNRTATSAREITEIIEAVREETRETAEVVASGAGTIEQGVAEAAEAIDVLERIRQKARFSAHQVGEIMSVVGEQARQIGEVEGAMKQVGELALSTGRATREQEQVGGRVSQRLEEIGLLGRQVAAASEEQRTQSGLITQAVEEISAGMEQILKSSQAQVAYADTVDAALGLARDVGRTGLERADANHTLIERLVERASHLEGSIESFQRARAQDAPASGPASPGTGALLEIEEQEESE